MKEQEVEAEFQRLETLIRSENAETRRHFAVFAESLDEKLKWLADGHIALRDDVTQLKVGQARLEVVVARLDVRQEAVESRMGNLEDRMGGLENRMGGLENRMGGLEDRMGSLEDRTGGLEEKMDVVVTETRRLSDRLPE